MICLKNENANAKQWKCISIDFADHAKISEYFSNIHEFLKQAFGFEKKKLMNQGTAYAAVVIWSINKSINMAM